MAHLLSADVLPVHVQTDAAVLHDAGSVEDERHVTPLTLLGEFRAPEAYVRVVQHRLQLQLLDAWENESS